MLNVSFTEKFGKTRQLTLGSMFLVANAIVWYFLAARLLEDTVTHVAANYVEALVFWGIHFGSLALSTIVGGSLMQRIGRKNLFAVWTTLGVISPFALLALNFAQAPVTFLLSLLFGVSLGLGMPNCMEYFTSLTKTENRGRYGGITMLIVGLGLISTGAIDVNSVGLSVFILAIWRLLGFSALLMLKSPKEDRERNSNVSYTSVFGQRSFVLYLIPWIMFSLVNYLSVPVQFTILGKLQVESLMIIENVLIGIFAIAGGFLSDYFGRKRTAIVGFVLVGIGYSVLGLYPESITSWYFYTVVDGVAWGFFYVIFVLSVWGDLSYGAPSDKYYAIGVLPFFISKFLQFATSNYIAGNISPYALFSFTAFFLFLAVLPLVYVPETLPEKTMKDRELKNYIEKAQKEAAKAQEKEAESEQRENVDATVEIEGDDFEEKLKEAEKYY